MTFPSPTDFLATIKQMVREELNAQPQTPKIATIDPAYSSGDPRVTFDGETALSTRTYPYNSTYTPVAGDRVVMIPIGPVYWIVGSVGAAAPSALPSGTMAMFGAPAAPSGWLICDGLAYSRTTYAGLYAAIGTTYGAGDGSTTFNVPDLRGRVPVGEGNGSGLSSRLIGSVGGEENHILSTAEMPVHSHTGYTGTGGTGTYVTTVTARAIYAGGGANGAFYASTSSSDYHNHTISPEGSGYGHNNMQPFVVVNMIIKV